MPDKCYYLWRTTLDCPEGARFDERTAVRRRIAGENSPQILRHSPKLVAAQPQIGYSVVVEAAKMAIPFEWRWGGTAMKPGLDREWAKTAGIGRLRVALLAPTLVLLVVGSSAVYGQETPSAEQPSAAAVGAAAAEGPFGSLPDPAPRLVNAGLDVGPDLFNGALAVEYPIAVAEGRAELKPDVRLRYHSRSGPGSAGLGWKLEPGQVTLDLRRGIDYAHGPFVLRLGDLECELVQRDGNQYSCRRESFFYRIVKRQVTGSVSWEVTNRDGLVYSFGATADSRLSNPSNRNQVITWFVDQATDTSGNTTHYYYRKRTDSSVPMLASIVYSDHAQANPQHEIRFETEPRPDSAVRYPGTFPVRQTERFSAIEIRSFDQRVDRIELDYTQDPIAGQSILTSLTRRGAEHGFEATGEVTSFGYNSPHLGWNMGSWQGPVPGQPISNQCLVGDFDGDGRGDVACWTGGYEGPQEESYHRLRTPFSRTAYEARCNEIFGPDWHLEKKLDDKDEWWRGEVVIHVRCQQYSRNWHVALARDNGFSTAYWTQGTRPGTSEYPFEGQIGRQCLSGDFDGDSKSDIACYQRAGEWLVARSTGSGWNTSTWRSIPAPPLPVSQSCLVADLDGLSD